MNAKEKGKIFMKIQNDGLRFACFLAIILYQIRISIVNETVFPVITHRCEPHEIQNNEQI